MRAYKANMIPGGVTPTINVSQYDNDYAVTVTLIEGAEIYTPPAGATIRVEGTKPDGHGFEYPCTYQGNVVTMPIYTQMTVVSGRFPIELVVYQSGLRVGSCNIIFAVEKAPLGEDADISETVIPDIIAGAQAQADAAAASATQAASSAASAETAKDAAMDAAQAAAQSAASLTVDTELSSTSTNPVQNKVIDATVTELKNDLDGNLGVITLPLYNNILLSVGSTTSGWKLTGVSGLCTQDAGYKLDKYSVSAGDTLEIVSDHLFQFQSAASVPASGSNQYLIGDTKKDGTFFVVVPDNAVWLIVSTPTSGEATVAKVTSVVSPLVPLRDISYKATGNMLDFGYIGNTWEQGAPGNANPYQCKTKKIPVTPGKTIYGVVNGAKMAETSALASFTIALWVVAYTEDDAQIDSKNMSNSSGQETNFYNIPSNCDYVIAYLTSGAWGNQFSPSTLDNAAEAFAYLGYDEIAYTEVLPNYIPYGVYNEANIQKIDNETKYWKGKKIVWFGTSIPAGVVTAGASGGNGAYPTRIGEALGATVYNESIGSSRVRGGNYHAISADDPMGWGGCEAIGVMLSMSLSRAEKQAIIDSWDSKWKDVMLEPNTYNPDNIAGYLNSSWDTILTKYLSGGSVGQCDLYVFDHGYNDGVMTYGFSDLDEIPAQSDNRTYWWGAMNFLIGKILADNPKAKILIIGHYNYSSDPFNRGENWAGKYVCDAQKAYAESWGMSCVETWKLLGLTMNTIDVNGTATPVIYARYPDHLHPASDSTGYELTRYADALTPYVDMARGT